MSILVRLNLHFFQTTLRCRGITLAWVASVPSSVPSAPRTNRVLGFGKAKRNRCRSESALAQGLSSSRLLWTRTLRLFSILNQGMPGSLRILASSLQSQSWTSLDIHHELVIFCYKLTMRRFTGAGASCDSSTI